MLMILVAESGSTKCDWLLLDEGGKHLETFHSEGFNPYFHSGEQIADALRKHDELRPISDVVDELYFFGAGCSSLSGNALIRGALQEFFQGAEVLVDHDMKAAAYSTWDGSPAISCILGTGSNSCYFDGRTIRQDIPSLAYILGDEGSGSFFGKRLLRQYFYRMLPEHLASDLDDTYDLNRDEVLEKVYREPFPNVYLADFMPFIVRHRTDPVIRRWIRDGFEEFLNIHVLSYEESGEVPVHFVGSIAALLEEELRQVGASMGLKTGEVLQKPGRRLARYIMEHKDQVHKNKKR